MEKNVAKIKNGHLSIHKEYELTIDSIESKDFMYDFECFSETYSENMQDFLKSCTGRYYINKKDWTITFEKNEDLILYLIGVAPEY